MWRGGMPLAEGAVSSTGSSAHMSALHTLPPAAGVVATTKTAAAATPTDPAAGDVSFAAVLSAQLGLSSTAPLSILSASSEDPASDHQALPDTVSTDAVADAANALSIVPLALPVTVQGPAAVEDSAQDAPKSDKPALVGKTLLPSAETLRSTFVPAQPIPESESAQTPANFAAALQALPAPGEDRHQHAAAAADTPS